MSSDIENWDPVYRFCNLGTYYTAHIFTLGWCSGYTILANADAAAKGKPIDYAGISVVLSGISFLLVYSLEKVEVRF